MNMLHLSKMKRKKLFYVPGLISLLGIPIIVFCFSQAYKPSKLTSVKLFIPADRKCDDQFISFSKGCFYKSIKDKKIIRVDLNEPSALEQPYLFQHKLDFISREIERLQFTNDTSS